MGENKLKINTKSLLEEDLDGEKIPLSVGNIQKAPNNSIKVINNGFAYDEYFKMGGTVGKMNLQTTTNFYNYKKNKMESSK